MVRVLHLFRSPSFDPPRAIILSNDSIENAPLERNLHKLHGTSSWRSSWIADTVEKHGRGTRIKSGIGPSIDSGDKYARTPADWRKRGSGRRGRRKRRRFISRTTRKCRDGTVPWSRVGRSVGRSVVGPCAWPRVCACPSRGRCRAKVGGGPCYARRGPPRPTAPAILSVFDPSCSREQLFLFP